MSHTEFQAQTTETTFEDHHIEDVKNNLGPSMSAIGYSNNFSEEQQ